MLAFVISLVSVALFGAVLWQCRIVQVARALNAQALAGISTLFDSTLTELEKERGVRQAGIRVAGRTGVLTLVFGGALLLAALPIMLVDWAGITSAQAVLSLMMRLDYILGGQRRGVFGAVVGRAKPPSIVCARGERRLFQH